MQPILHRLSGNKRSWLPDPDPEDRELSAKRQRNDARHENRWDSIIERYSKDFSNVGDEIDLQTGEVVVDNGHLSGMRNEFDNGDGLASKGGVLSQYVMVGEGEYEEHDEDDEEAEDEDDEDQEDELGSDWPLPVSSPRRRRQQSSPTRDASPFVQVTSRSSPIDVGLQPEDDALQEEQEDDQDEEMTAEKEARLPQNPQQNLRTNSLESTLPQFQMPQMHFGPQMESAMAAMSTAMGAAIQAQMLAFMNVMLNAQQNGTAIPAAPANLAPMLAASQADMSTVPNVPLKQGMDPPLPPQNARIGPPKGKTDRSRPKSVRAQKPSSDVISSIETIQQRDKAIRAQTPGFGSLWALDQPDSNHIRNPLRRPRGGARPGAGRPKKGMHKTKKPKGTWGGARPGSGPKHKRKTLDSIDITRQIAFKEEPGFIDLTQPALKLKTLARGVPASNKPVSLSVSASPQPETSVHDASPRDETPLFPEELFTENDDNDAALERPAAPIIADSEEDELNTLTPPVSSEASSTKTKIARIISNNAERLIDPSPSRAFPKPHDTSFHLVNESRSRAGLRKAARVNYDDVAFFATMLDEEVPGARLQCPRNRSPHQVRATSARPEARVVIQTIPRLNAREQERQETHLVNYDVPTFPEIPPESSQLEDSGESTEAPEGFEPPREKNKKNREYVYKPRPHLHKYTLAKAESIGQEAQAPLPRPKPSSANISRPRDQLQPLNPGLTALQQFRAMGKAEFMRRMAAITSSARRKTKITLTFDQRPPPLPCVHCKATAATSWYPNPEGGCRRICNSCLGYSKVHNGEKRPTSLEGFRSLSEKLECENCCKLNVSNWMPKIDGMCLCNQCGRYAKNHGKMRPVTRPPLCKCDRCAEEVHALLALSNRARVCMECHNQLFADYDPKNDPDAPNEEGEKGDSLLVDGEVFFDRASLVYLVNFHASYRGGWSKSYETGTPNAKGAPCKVCHVFKASTWRPAMDRSMICETCYQRIIITVARKGLRRMLVEEEESMVDGMQISGFQCSDCEQEIQGVEWRGGEEKGTLYCLACEEKNHPEAEWPTRTGIWARHASAEVAGKDNQPNCSTRQAMRNDNENQNAQVETTVSPELQQPHSCDSPAQDIDDAGTSTSISSRSKQPDFENRAKATTAALSSKNKLLPDLSDSAEALVGPPSHQLPDQTYRPSIAALVAALARAADEPGLHNTPPMLLSDFSRSRTGTPVSFSEFPRGSAENAFVVDDLAN